MIASLGALAISESVSLINFSLSSLTNLRTDEWNRLVYRSILWRYEIKRIQSYFRFGLNLFSRPLLLFMIFLLIWPEITMNVFNSKSRYYWLWRDVYSYYCYSHIPFAIAMMCGVAFRVKEIPTHRWLLAEYLFLKCFPQLSTYLWYLGFPNGGSSVWSSSCHLDLELLRC